QAGRECGGGDDGLAIAAERVTHDPARLIFGDQQLIFVVRAVAVGRDEDDSGGNDDAVGLDERFRVRSDRDVHFALAAALDEGPAAVAAGGKTIDLVMNRRTVFGGKKIFAHRIESEIKTVAQSEGEGRVVRAKGVVVGDGTVVVEPDDSAG